MLHTRASKHTRLPVMDYFNRSFRKMGRNDVNDIISYRRTQTPCQYCARHNFCIIGCPHTWGKWSKVKDPPIVYSAASD